MKKKGEKNPEDSAITALRNLDDALFAAKQRREDYYKRCSKGNTTEAEWSEINRSIKEAQLNLTKGCEILFPVIRRALSQVKVNPSVKS